MPDMNQIKTEMANLRHRIEKANKEYYDNDNPSLEDFEYDQLTRRLRELEAAYPEWAADKSPIAVIGGEASSLFAPVAHTVIMESLQDIFSYEELDDFDNRVKTTIGETGYVVEPKVDGLSVSLEYRDGVFVRGSTRGDGRTGEDVTANLMTIKDIPKTIKGAPAFLEVRGEVYMSKKVFAELAAEAEENGDVPFKNPRNAAAGSLRQKDSAVTTSRKLSTVIFNIQQMTGEPFVTHHDGLDFLRRCGFAVSDDKKASGVAEMKALIEGINMNRSSFPFDIDGAVVKVDDIAKRKLLGSTSKFPRWAVAYKYPPEIKASKLLRIELDVTRTGTLSSTAVFEPVTLAGTSVSRALLHNQDFIDEKQIAVGDILLVRKAGDIIPEIVGVEKHCGAPVYQLPHICPVCGEPAVRDADGPAVRCHNESCPSVLYWTIVHFAERAAMDIEGLGPAIVRQLLDKKLITDAAGLYTLSADPLAQLDKFGEKSAVKLIAAIEKSRSNQLHKLLFALGIPHVGEAGARLLADHFGSLDALRAASEEEISAIEGFGGITAEGIRAFFQNPKNISLIDKLKQAGVNMSESDKAVTDVLAGQSFVITGTLSRPRDEIKQLIMENGGKVAGSVSKNTNFVVAGESAGSKLKDAQKLGVPVLTEQQLIEMLQA